MSLLLTLLPVALAGTLVNAYFKHDCTSKPDSGPCNDFQLMWYYDSEEKICKTFLYGGCGGNSNLFMKQEDCEASCRKFPECKRCCPEHRFLEYNYYDYKSGEYCDDDLSCPKEQICCPTSYYYRKKCVDPVECCCPKDNYYYRKYYYDYTYCRDERDCPDDKEVCCTTYICWYENGYYNYGYRQICRPAEPCDCTPEPLCCPSNYDCTEELDPDCSQCLMDSNCRPDEKCCNNGNGCYKCKRAYICDKK